MNGNLPESPRIDKSDVSFIRVDLGAYKAAIVVDNLVGCSCPWEGYLFFKCSMPAIGHTNVECLLGLQLGRLSDSSNSR